MSDTWHCCSTRPLENTGTAHAPWVASRDLGAEMLLQFTDAEQASSTDDEHLFGTI